ncbi:MAG: hypothetical protein ABJF07_08775 [Nisaea sp.]|uniref:hypothetical protein n=1 Tax=Nisaea sp. TaxID=2024842 RepID=UPI003267A61E
MLHHVVVEDRTPRAEGSTGAPQRARYMEVRTIVWETVGRERYARVPQKAQVLCQWKVDACLAAWREGQKGEVVQCF